MAAPALIAATRGNAADPAIVETSYGKLRGAQGTGVISFKGIPYAADTSGKNRFMPPRPPAKWAGVRDALEYGDRCPQARRPGGSNQPPAGKPPHYGENCCVLNIYTPGTSSTAKRPVMFYIHGGGFSGGSGDTPQVEGSNLARFGDVVVVTVNHRLNIFGYGNLGYLGSEFADAGNAGQLDLIAALRWVRTNIRAFGGDPERVTIFGESGGGAKIVALAVTPAAKGLYRNTINMSGAGAFFLRTPDQTQHVTDELLKVLGVGKGDVRRLQEIPAEQLFAAHSQSLANLKADQARPLIDKRNIICAPLSREGLALQTALPGIMSCTATEATPWLLRDRRNLQVDKDEVTRRVKAQFKFDDAKARSVVDAYLATDPQQSAWDLLVNIASDAMMRTPMLRVAEAKSAVGGQPVYFCDFAWKSSAEGGIWGGPHGVDVPFAFGNTASERLVAGSEQTAREASKNLMSAYVAFARNGTPNNAAMPEWTPYSPATRKSMVIDSSCQLASDRFAERRQVSEVLPTQSTFEVTEGPLMHQSA